MQIAATSDNINAKVKTLNKKGNDKRVNNHSPNTSQNRNVEVKAEKEDTRLKPREIIVK